MTMLTNELYNKIMLFNSHPTADMIRECITEAGEGKFIHRGNVEWLIGDTDYDGADDCQVYVITKCLKHKYQVKVPLKNTTPRYILSAFQYETPR